MPRSPFENRLTALAFVACALVCAPAAAAEPEPADAAGRGRTRALVVVDAGDAAGSAATVTSDFADHGFVDPSRMLTAHDAREGTLRLAMTHLDAMTAGIPARDLTLFAFVLEGKGHGVEATERVAAKLAAFPAIARVVVSRSCDAAPSIHVAKEATHLRIAFGGPCDGTDPLRAFLLGASGAADVDDDHMITIAEALQYVADEAQAFGQKIAVDVDRTAPELGIVLGHDASFPDGAELVLPRSPSPPLYRIFVYGERQELAVAHGRTDRDVRVRVPVGRLVVHVLGATDDRGLDLRVGRAEVSHLSPTEGRAMDRALLDADRGLLTKATHELSVAYGGALGGYASFAHGAALRYTYAHPTYAFSLAGSAALGGTSNPQNENLYTIFGARARAERRFFSGVPMVALGAGLVGEIAVQSLHRTDSTAIAGTGYAVIERYRAGAFGPEVFMNVRTTVGGTSFFGAELAAVFPFAPTTANGLQAYPRVEGSLYAGLSF